MVDKKKSSPNFSKTLLQQLRRTFGARLYPFFDYYTKLYGMASGFEEVPEDLASDFRATMRIVTQHLSKDDTKDAIASQLSEIMPVLRRIEKGADMDSIWRLLSRTMQDAVVTVARDRDVYLKTRRIHPQGWAYFKKMSPDEEAMEKLRLRDPDAYAIAQQAKEIRRDVDKAIISKIQDAGYVVEKKAVLGKVVYTGVATDGTSLVFDEDGEVLPVEDYITKRKEFLASYDKLSKTFNVDLEGMRAASDEDLQRIATQPVEYVSLTDDRAKQGALTRIYPTRRLGDRKVITEGRFKGIYLDDMINAAGRQIEGVAYDFDPKTGIPRTLESRASGSLEVGNVKEPYITVADDGRLYLKMPATHAFSDLRKAMSDVAKFNTGIEKVAGSRNASFYFSPKDFGSVREALGSVALSKRAAQVIEKYFRTLAKHELATAKENLGKYDASTLGGFREGRNLYTVQKKALAWADSRGGSGVLALQTGVGKTSLGLGAIKMAMNEMDAEGKPFRALYVCPKSLKGNLPSEAYQFMEDPKRFIEQTDILSYTEFAKKGKNDPNFLSQYTIILFDEAQELASGTSMAAKIASRPHPRKIFLTASPMEKRPSEVYTLAALANNEDVTKPLFKRNRLNFEKRFCVEIGGRFVGVNPDPLVRRDLRTWVRQNMFHADKQSVEEYLLPDIQKMPRALTLSPEVEAEYRLITKDIKEILAGLVERFRDQKDTKRSRDKLVSTARMKLAGQFSKLMTLSNLPSKIIPGAPNPKIDAASRIIEEKIEKSGRTILFTDIPDMAVETARQLSVDYPGTRHACCLSTKIEIYKNGSVEMTFTPKIYTSATRTYTKDEWQMYVMETYIKPNDYDVVTATLTAPYAKGHNLQMFTTVVHLDRDSWNAEMMQQREARAWRQGQKNSVEAITLDMTYSETSNDYDRTLDEIMRYSQEMEEDLFNQIIVASQTQALGQEYFEMSQEVTSTYYAQRKAFELAMSPYANVHADVVEGENNAAMVESDTFYPHEDLTIEDFLDMGVPYDQLVDPMNKLI